MQPHPSTYSIRLTFGANIGKSLGELYQYKRTYLEWLSGANGIPNTWRIAAAKTLLGEPVDTVFPEPPKIPVIRNVDEITISPFNSKRFSVQFPFNSRLKDELKFVVDGVTWHPDELMWSFPIPQVVRVINWFGGPSKVVVHEEVKAAYLIEKEHVAKLKEISSRLTSDLVVKTKIPLRGDQLVAIEFSDATGGSMLEADDTGNGKTAIALGWALHRGGKTLISVPNNLQIQWTEQIEKFTDKKWCIWYANKTVGDLKAPFHIVHYDVIDRYVKKFNKMKFKNLICDEAGKITNYKTVRTKAIMGVKDEGTLEAHVYPGLKVDNVALLTASPIKNKPRELYTLLNFLDEGRFSKPKHFINRYEGASTNGQYQNLDELYERASELMIRRPKSILGGHTEQAIDLIVELSDIQIRKYVEYMTKLLKLWGKTTPSASDMHEVRRYLFNLKWDRTIELAEELIESNRSVLAFGIQQEHVERMANHFGRLGRFVHGEVKPTERERIKKGLIDGTYKFGAYTLETGAMGMDGLQTAISDTIFPERSFLPVDHIQAHGRTARPGQLQRPQMYYLTAHGTHDVYSRDLLVKKMEMINQSVDGKTLIESQLNAKTQESMFKDVVSWIATEYKQKNILPVID